MTSGGRSRSAAEWVTLALSVVVVGALVAVALIEESQREGRRTAGLEVTFATDQVEVRGERFYVPYTIRNTGAEAISSAEIWIEVYDGERQAESVEVAVQFLPLRGVQDGIFVTANDPATHSIVSRMESLQFP